MVEQIFQRVIGGGRCGAAVYGKVETIINILDDIPRLFPFIDILGIIANFPTI